MEHAADPTHPRYNSLLKRKMIEDAAKIGMLADSALIAHGRGEAFDYLIGERTIESAMDATKEAAARLCAAERPVISLNGNVMALAAKPLLRCAAVIGADVEVNIFYRTPERMKVLMEYLKDAHVEIADQTPPEFDAEVWQKMVVEVRLLGNSPDGRIPGLEGPRANCHSDGILASDVILVPLEDGDRCEALVEMGKDVIVVDLNPLSRSAKMAKVTVVDELCRFAENLYVSCLNPAAPNDNWDNPKILQTALEEIIAGAVESA